MNKSIKDEIRSITCCFSGHREIPPELHTVMHSRLEIAVNRMYERRYRRFIAGGAVGFDTYAAYHVLNLKKSHNEIELILALPYKRPTDLNASTLHGRIVQSADYVIYTSERYTPDCMFIRNKFMVDLSGACLCWLQNKKGGTAQTIEYAQNQQLEIYNLIT